MLREVVITQEWLMTHLPQRLGVSPRKFPGAVKRLLEILPEACCGSRLCCNLISHGAPKIGLIAAGLGEERGSCREINGLLIDQPWLHPII